MQNESSDNLIMGDRDWLCIAFHKWNLGKGRYMRAAIVGTLSLEDGRTIAGRLTGNNYPDTYMDQGGFDPDENDPMTLQWMDGVELSDAEYEEFGDLLFEYLMDKGKMLYPEDELDDYGIYDDIDLYPRSVQ